jgi:hypothetical protein
MTVPARDRRGRYLPTPIDGPEIVPPAAVQADIDAAAQACGAREIERLHPILRRHDKLYPHAVRPALRRLAALRTKIRRRETPLQRSIRHFGDDDRPPELDEMVAILTAGLRGFEGRRR